MDGRLMLDAGIGSPYGVDNDEREVGERNSLISSSRLMQLRMKLGNLDRNVSLQWQVPCTIYRAGLSNRPELSRG